MSIPYAKAKTITSMSGADTVRKHLKTLERAQQLLLAQGDEASRQAALIITSTKNAYRAELAAFYHSEHYPYRDAV